MYLDAELADSDSAMVTAVDQNAADGKAALFTLEDGRTYEPILLSHQQGDDHLVVGVAVLAVDTDHWREVHRELIVALSRALLKYGEVAPRVAAI
jgi:hypothetical protein